MLDILHLHGFKCAGTTMSWILERNFAGQVAYVESTGRGSRLAWQQVESEVPLDSFRALTSHLITLPDCGRGPSAMYVALVGEPRARLRSAYAFQSRTNSLPGSVATFEEFIAHSRNSMLSNYQTRHLSSQDHGGWLARSGWQLRPELIDLARDDLLIGTVERFDETMVLLEHRLATRGIPFDASYPSARNRTDHMASELLETKIPVDMVELDDVLYTRATESLSRQMVGAGLNSKLEEFRTRCAQMDSTSLVVSTQSPSEWVYLSAEAP